MNDRRPSHLTGTLTGKLSGSLAGLGLLLPTLLLSCSDAPAGTPDADAFEAAGEAARAKPVAYAAELAQDRTPPPAKKVPVTGEGEGGGEQGDAPPKPGDDPAVQRQNPGTFGGEKDPKAKLAIEYGSEKYDFGSARQGDILDHTFELESAGENAVKIRQASPTCGCTVSQILVENAAGEFEEYKLGDPVEPGRKIRIGAKLDTAHKQNKTNVRINVYNNDPIGLTQLSLSADIEPFIRATPAFLNFADIKEGTSKTQAIDIRTSRGEKVALTLDPSNPIQMPEGLEIDLQPVNPDDDGRAGHWRATVTVGEGAQEGPIGYQLRLLTDVEMPAKEPEHSVDDGHGHEPNDPALLGAKVTYHQVNASVSGRVLGPLSFTPQFVSLGLVRPGQRVPRNVKLISHDPDFDLSGVKVELRGEGGRDLAFAEFLTTSVRPATGMSNALDIQLQLEGLPEGTDGSFRGEMVIHTGHPRKPELLVRFSGVCRAGVVRTGGGEK